MIPADELIPSRSECVALGLLLGVAWAFGAMRWLRDLGLTPSEWGEGLFPWQDDWGHAHVVDFLAACVVATLWPILEVAVACAEGTRWIKRRLGWPI